MSYLFKTLQKHCLSSAVVQALIHLTKGDIMSFLSYKKAVIVHHGKYNNNKKVYIVSLTM